MIGLIIAIVFKEAVAGFCISAIGYVTTAYVSIRLGYDAKSGVENYQKIRKKVQETNDENNG